MSTENEIRQRKETDFKTKGRELARQHLQKYPTVDFDTQRELAEELKDLEALRPTINDMTTP